MGASLRGRTTTHASKKGEKVLGRVLRRLLRRGLSMDFTAKEGSEKGFSEGVLRRGFAEGA